MGIRGSDVALVGRPMAGWPVRGAELIARAWDELVPPESKVLNVLIAGLSRKTRPTIRAPHHARRWLSAPLTPERDHPGAGPATPT